MSSDIQPGDVVVCVPLELSTCPNTSSHAAHMRAAGEKSMLKAGRLYRVDGVIPNPVDGRTLALAGLPTGAGWCCGRFRKIDAPKSELSERIKACRPIRQPEHA